MRRAEANEFEDDGMSHAERQRIASAKIARRVKRRRIADAVRGWAAILIFAYFGALFFSIFFIKEAIIPLFLAWPLTIVLAAVVALITVVLNQPHATGPDLYVARHVTRSR